MNTDEAGQLAAQRVAAVREDAPARAALAAEFYAPALSRYGAAELRFLRWESERGVLDPRTGSPWWRAVNDRLLQDKTEAALLDRGGVGRTSTPAVARWLEFRAAPSPVAWYRAHNHSIVSAYLDHRDLAETECAAEQFMINVTLGRVLFTQVMAQRPALALGRFARLGPRLADPCARSVGLFLNLRNVFPERYPLHGISIDEILATEGRIARVIDFGLIVPKLDRVYRFAAHSLAEPRLLDLVRDGVFSYAGPEVARRLTPGPLSRMMALVTGPV